MRKRLSGKEIKELNPKIEKFGVSYHKKDNVVISDRILLLDNEPQFFYYKEQLAPTLKLELKNQILPQVTIDMPAVKFIADGADVMRPGITQVDKFDKNDIVAIVDETHHKAIAIGKAKFSSEQINKMQKGKVIENLHHVGDEIWDFV
ncbi:MAG: Glutamate 5-kinase [Candidatus Woesearchaeota archaeon]|nr:Glutamate 5-kinase [Candidatus Woesearchaeota archaeon]